MKYVALRKTLQSALCLCLTPLMVAQQAAEPQSARYRSLPTATIPDEVVIPKGTRIELVSLEHVSSDTAKEKSLVRFALAKDLVVNGVKVLDVGTPVEGKVSRVRRGVPYRQWGELTITIRRIQIGNHAHMRLRSSDPENPESMVDEWAQCALVFPLCITAIIAFSTLSRTKPTGDNERAVLPPCVGWTFWTGSSFRFTKQHRAESKAAHPPSSQATCSNIASNQSLRGVQVK
ncbi:hypothetical protein P8935_23395 [Telmatobacter sp. DSM 110680]|uniref:Uncharacterized protein n=1 Tax=Telmatobacter sp. DSM 110680 TaxID=3036704 RepID=A0AAU7DHD9_9BACT